MSERKIYDAHVHIRPGHMLGSTDPALGSVMQKYGKMLLTSGEIFQLMPPYFGNSCFDADTLIATLDTYRIERAAIMQAFVFRINEDVAKAVEKYPDRLRGAMVVNPQDKDYIDQMRYWNSRGLSILKFEMSIKHGFSNPGAYPGLRFNSELMNSVFNEAEKLGLTVVVDTNRVGFNGYQVEELDEAIKKHRDLKFVICHLGFAQLVNLEDADKMARWSQMIDLAANDNVWFDVTALPDLFAAEGYPFASAVKLVEDFISKYGQKKVLWGTDIPGTLGNATYKQMIDMFDKCSSLSEEAKDDLFYNNAIVVYGL